MNSLLNWSRLATKLSVSLALAGCGGGGDLPGRGSAQTDAALEWGACPAALQDPSARCGVLRVRQNPASSAAGLIRLPFAILPARASNPRPDPVLFYGGGPGPSVLATVAQLDAESLRTYPLRQNRDLILLDARGASELHCPELEETPAQLRFTTLERTLTSVQACANRVKAGGTQLRFHHSATMAEDARVFKQLIGAARGYQEWNLVGTSYGTRVLLQELGRGVSGLRTIVLDGPMSPNTRLLNEAPLLEALDALLERCSADLACGTAYPNLRTRFASALVAIQDRPLKLPDGRIIDGERVLEAMRGQLAAGAGSVVPLLMHWVANGQVQVAADVFGLTDAYQFVPNPSLLFYASVCQDDASAALSSGASPLYGSKWPAPIRQMASDADGRVSRAICSKLAQALAVPPTPVTPAPAVRSVPTLLSVGEFDPLTPRSGAIALAAGWTKVRELVIDREGHGLLEGSPCALAETQRFIDAPSSYQPGPCARARRDEPFLVQLP